MDTTQAPPDHEPTDPLYGRLVGLYVDGHHVSCESVEAHREPGSRYVTVTMRTSIGALDNPQVDARLDAESRGFKAGQPVSIQVSEDMPTTGHATLVEIMPSLVAGGATMALIRALGRDIIDPTSGRVFVKVDAEGEVPLDWLRPMEGVKELGGGNG